MVKKKEVEALVAVIEEQALELGVLREQVKEDDAQWSIPPMPAVKDESTPLTLADLKHKRRLNVLDDGKEFNPEYWFAAFHDRQGRLGWVQTAHLHPIISHRLGTMLAMNQGARQIIEQIDPYTIAYPTGGQLLELHRKMTELDGMLHGILRTVMVLDLPDRVGDMEKPRDDPEPKPGVPGS